VGSTVCRRENRFFLTHIYIQEKRGVGVVRDIAAITPVRI
jgi:hypothetical protein